ncbi:zinc-ribbon domain containing protein [Candidatus Daviesbacteria bacterium]|nr:zinc-ribbon domain containing protein [Candidatus Daviesbacteria bacterium]
MTQIKCINCEKIFIFGTKDQEYFKQNQWPEPKRCKACKQEVNNRNLYRRGI